jgi:hypothetical protein
LSLANIYRVSLMFAKCGPKPTPRKITTQDTRLMPGPNGSEAPA